jgi:lipopolysaccharide transport system ATP-binding protein
MYLRLAFSVAAHLDVDVLLVDEVLAVGDAAFQKKCLGKMKDVAGRGRTVLFVSHNMLAVDSLCTRAICLHEGRVVLEGPPLSVTSRYLQNWLPAFREVVHDDIKTAPGNDMIRLHRARIRPLNGSFGDQLTVRTPFAVEFEYWKLTPHTRLFLAAQVYNEHGVSVFAAADSSVSIGPASLLRCWFTVPADFMNNGTYRLTLAVFLNGIGGTMAAEWEDLLVFEIHDAPSELRGAFHGQWPGTVRPNLKWKTEFLEPLPASVAKDQSL